MIRLHRSLADWGRETFAETLGAEVSALPPWALPLHQLASTGHPLDTRVTVTLLSSWETGATIEARLGIFFEESLPGCSCGDEPEPQPAYGELRLRIDRVTALAVFAPVEGGAP